MKQLIKIKAFVLIMLVSVTSSQAQIKSDYDKERDFTQYHTYSFEGWQKDSDKQLNEFDKQRLQDALKTEFEKRGLTLADSDPDAMIALYVVLEKKSSTTAYTDFVGGMGYGPRWGWGMGAGMGSATTTYQENDYVEGTLVVDMYDAGDKKLIWQGVISTVVEDKPEKREKTIPKKIGKLMKEFPKAPEK